MIREIGKLIDSPFSLYEKMSEFMEEKGAYEKKHSRDQRYKLLYLFIEETFKNKKDFLLECLIKDFYLRENAKKRPEFFGDETVSKEEKRAFYDKEKKENKYLPFYKGESANYLRKVTHMEKLFGKYYLFVYNRRDPLSNNAMCIEVEK